MKRTFTCIVCPNSCEITTEYEDGRVLSVEGNQCPKGRDYVTRELTDPRRTVTSSIRILHGELPLASVRLTEAVPKDRIFDVMREIGRCELQAPVTIGQVAIRDVLGLGSDVIITRNVGENKDLCR